MWILVICYKNNSLPSVTLKFGQMSFNSCMKTARVTVFDSKRSICDFPPPDLYTFNNMQKWSDKMKVQAKNWSITIQLQMCVSIRVIFSELYLSAATLKNKQV